MHRNARRQPWPSKFKLTTFKPRQRRQFTECIADPDNLKYRVYKRGVNQNGSDMAVTAAFVIDLVVMFNSRPALDILNTVLDYNIALIYSCTSLLLLTTQYVRLRTGPF